MINTTINKIADETSYKAIVDAVVGWAKANHRDVETLVQGLVQRGFSEQQAIHREVSCDGWHQLFINDDGMGARFTVGKSYLFFGEVTRQEVVIEVKFQERIVPALPLAYDVDTHYTTVSDATRIRKRIVDMMNQPI